MEINEAIIHTRKRALLLRRYAFFNRRTSYALVNEAARDALAMETVCDALEAFLKKQEEDNSYHSQGGRPHANC